MSFISLQGHYVNCANLLFELSQDHIHSKFLSYYIHSQAVNYANSSFELFLKIILYQVSSCYFHTPDSLFYLPTINFGSNSTSEASSLKEGWSRSYKEIIVISLDQTGTTLTPHSVTKNWDGSCNTYRHNYLQHKNFKILGHLRELHTWEPTLCVEVGNRKLQDPRNFSWYLGDQALTLFHWCPGLSADRQLPGIETLVLTY